MRVTKAGIAQARRPESGRPRGAAPGRDRDGAVRPHSWPWRGVRSNDCC